MKDKFNINNHMLCLTAKQKKARLAKENQAMCKKRLTNTEKVCQHCGENMSTNIIVVREQFLKCRTCGKYSTYGEPTGALTKTEEELLEKSNEK